MFGRPTDAELKKNAQYIETADIDNRTTLMGARLRKFSVGDVVKVKKSGEIFTVKEIIIVPQKPYVAGRTRSYYRSENGDRYSSMELEAAK